MVTKREPLVVRETMQQQMEYWAKEKYEFRHFQEKVTAASIDAAKVYKRSRIDDTKPATEPTKKEQKGGNSNKFSGPKN